MSPSSGESRKGYDEKDVGLFPSRILDHVSLKLWWLQGECLAENEDSGVEIRAKGERKQDKFLLSLVTFLNGAKFHPLNSP